MPPMNADRDYMMYHPEHYHQQHSMIPGSYGGPPPKIRHKPPTYYEGGPGPGSHHLHPPPSYSQHPVDYPGHASKVIAGPS